MLATSSASASSSQTGAALDAVPTESGAASEASKPAKLESFGEEISVVDEGSASAVCMPPTLARSSAADEKNLPCPDARSSCSERPKNPAQNKTQAKFASS